MAFVEQLLQSIQTREIEDIANLYAKYDKRINDLKLQRDLLSFQIKDNYQKLRMHVMNEIENNKEKATLRSLLDQKGVKIGDDVYHLQSNKDTLNINLNKFDKNNKDLSHFMKVTVDLNDVKKEKVNNDAIIKMEIDQNQQIGSIFDQNDDITMKDKDIPPPIAHDQSGNVEQSSLIKIKKVCLNKIKI